MSGYATAASQEPGRVVWVTGSSERQTAALARRVHAQLQRRGTPSELVDEAAAVLWPEICTPELHAAAVRRAASLAELLTRHGVTVVTAAVAPERALREEIRSWLGERLVEVHLAEAPEPAGEAPVAGYEPPLDAEVTVLGDAPELAVARVLAQLDGVPLAEAATSDTLAFIVIGVQKGGTTSLWHYLRGHPQIRLPEDKEAPIFATADGGSPEAVEQFRSSYFAGAPAGTLLGTVSPQYMMGGDGLSAERIAQRIAALLPHVRLIALLRDPIDRAVSHYRMSVRRGIESRTFDEAAQELLDPARLAIAREQPTETNSYLVQGEYGRILGAYRALVPPQRLLVEQTSELARDPAGVLDRVVAFLGLPPGHRPEDLGTHHHAGGSRPRIDGGGEQALRGFFGAEVWPQLGPRAEPAMRAFNFFFETWNVIPDDARPQLDPSTRELLECHYTRDAAALQQLGIDAPWVARWDAPRVSAAMPPAARLRTAPAPAS